ncbi:primary-amine oxidase [Promicromonospora panici]|uniref:primary-amine oxidase n=1 Tax=Promicromonospora panici TaxID=2219658 RepID=UPI00101CBFDF|nr:primary-amine oxidase [Promicromonospora panici]
MTSTTSRPTAIGHPLAPLTAEELKAATEILARSGRVPDGSRFVSVSLQEPPKERVLAWDGTAPLDREAFVVVYDRPGRQLYETVVSLATRDVVRCKPVPGARPSYLLEEVFAVPEVVMADPRWQEAMRRRGVTDFSRAHVDPWPGAWLSETDPGERRVCRPLTWVRPPVENGHPYARPVEGLIAVVDLDEMEVIDVIDHGVVPLPELDGEYIPELMTEAGESNRPRFDRLRDDVQPLHISQPEGPSWTVEGHHVTWQKWSLRIGWTAREGLVLFDVRYDDRGELRRVLYRASIAEMVVPYGDPAPTHAHKLAFDEGEVGLGFLVTPLTLGCDCLGEIRYFDGLGVDQDGNPLVLPNAICMHEEDVGIAWKHFDYQRETTEVRRMRRLAISSIVNVANYEYGFFWYLYQDGSIEFEVKLTGVLSTGAYRPGEKPKHGTPVAPGLYGPNHQHFFCVRLDTDIDGESNTVVEVNSEAAPLGPDNPYGTGWVARETPLLTEEAAQRTVNPASARFWRIANPGRLNEMGAPVSYRLQPGANMSLLMDDSSPMRRRARFVTKHLWVTPYRPDERYAAGDYPWQNPGPDGLPRWTQADRGIGETDLVVWYVVGSHHVPRVEEWPVMPVAKVGFHLMPDGFFDGNAAVDLPRPGHNTHGNGHDHSHGSADSESSHGH